MPITNSSLERELLETAAGRAVYDALVQANVNVHTVSLEMVKQMLVAECRFRLGVGCPDSGPMLAVVS